MGVPLYRPVMVVKPRSECKVNLRGDGSRYVAIFSARDRAPTVTLDRSQVKPCARDNEYWDPYDSISNFAGSDA